MFEPVKQRVVLFGFLSLLFLLLTPASAAPANQSPDSMVIPKFGANDGKPLLNSLLGKVKAMHDYWYESSLTTFQKQKPVTEKGRFYFKTPDLIRFEAIDAGSHSGSVVVKQADGKIKAKAGGFLGGIIVSLSPNSKLLKTPNGYSIVESDLATLLEGVLHTAGGQNLVASPSPCSYPGLGRALVLELLGADNMVIQRLAIDQESKLPVDWLIFDKDKLASICHIEKIVSNANIADSLFQLGRESTIASGDLTKSLAGTDVLCSGLERRMARSSVNTPLDSQTKFEIKSLVDQIALEATQLKNESSATQSTSTTDIINYDQSESGATTAVKSLGAPVILIRTSEIESMVNSLRAVSPSIKNFDAITAGDVGSVALAADWDLSLVRISEGIANLYNLLDSDKTDLKVINQESERIVEQTKTLEGVLQRIPTPKVAR